MRVRGGGSGVRGRTHFDRHARRDRSDSRGSSGERRFARHVLGGGTARGICGSGLVDAAAAALDLGP